MKNKKHSCLTHSLPAKIIAFFLTSVMLTIAIASVIGAIIMYNENMYIIPKDFYLQRVYDDIETIHGYDSIAQSDCDNLVSYIHAADKESAVNYCIGRNIISVNITDGATDKTIFKWEYKSNNTDKDNIYKWSENFMEYYYYEEETDTEKVRCYSVEMTISIDPAVNDDYAMSYLSANERKALAEELINFAYSMLYRVYIIGAVSLILAIAGIVFLMCASGRRKNCEEVQAGFGTKIPFDLMSAAVAALIVILFAFCLACEQLTEFAIIIAVLAFAGVAGISIILGWLMSFAIRIKLGKWWQNTIIYRLYKLLKKGAKAAFNLIKEIPLVWKTALIVVGISLFILIVMMGVWDDYGNLMLIWFISSVVLGGAELYCAVIMKKLQKAGEALANGDLNYQIDTTKLFGDFKAHGEALNSIAKGMTIAVEERMKSERMKTELITNVSHDIKTPLTSIINYTDLISKETCENEKINEYSAVLLRQSERLKRLIDDLVEASKASTGNLDFVLEPCDANILLTQAVGEYEEKLCHQNLELITVKPSTPVLILADGRRLWRVFDNLLNNISKYAQSSTRVYLLVERQGNEAIITFKNTSHLPLNVSADELMQRFVRGDASRNTEGNGLGLSIAKSLVELQKGSFELSIDGDLFKVTLRFPVIK